MTEPLTELLDYCKSLGQDRNASVHLDYSRVDDWRRNEVGSELGCYVNIVYSLMDNDRCKNTDYIDPHPPEGERPKGRPNKTASVKGFAYNMSDAVSEAFREFKQEMEYRNER